MSRQSTRTYAAQRFYGPDDPIRSVEQALADHVEARRLSNLPPSRAAVSVAVSRMVEAEGRPVEQREAAKGLASMMIKALDDGFLQ